MKRISARFLTTMSTEQLWTTLRGPFVLVFDDGELETNAKESLYSSYAWEFHRKYPRTPMFKRHHVKEIIGKKRLANGTHLKLLGNVMWSVHAAYQDDTSVTLDQLSEMTYRIVNLMYNDLSYRCEPWVTSLDVTDYIEILNHPDVLAAKKDAPPTEQAIAHIHETITKVLLDDPSMAHNPIARAVKSGLSNMGQVLQCVGPRGFITDMDGNYFPRPIMRGFAEGFRDFHDSFIESRHASMSLAQAKDPLEQTEYFSRRLQLICQNVRRLHMTDCGSTEYLYWTIRDQQFDDDGNVSQKSDLDLLAGKYFVNAEGGLSAIRKTDKHLIGHTLKVRSTLGKCRHPDPYGVCAACFGELAYSILDPLTGNLGQTTCTSMTEVVSQLVLSTKHFVGNAMMEAIVLDNITKQYFDVTSDRASYLLHKRWKNHHVRLIIPHQFAAHFTDIQAVADVNQLTSISRISELPEIGIGIGNGEKYEEIALRVAMDRRMASMTYPLLAHIKKVGWSLNEKGHYIVDMSGWDYDKPILSLPMKRYNMSDHSAEIADILEASIKEIAERDLEESVDPTLVKLFDHVNHRLSVNLAVLEIVLYGGMVVSSANDNFALPKANTGRALGVYDLTIENRSMAAKMAYEHQLASILNPHNYITPNRMDHPFDAVIMPHEVLQAGEEEYLRSIGA